MNKLVINNQVSIKNNVFFMVFDDYFRVRIWSEVFYDATDSLTIFDEWCIVWNIWKHSMIKYNVLDVHTHTYIYIYCIYVVENMNIEYFLCNNEI